MVVIDPLLKVLKEDKEEERLVGLGSPGHFVRREDVDLRTFGYRRPPERTSRIWAFVPVFVVLVAAVCVGVSWS